MWLKGHGKVLCHTTFALLAVSVDALMRLMLSAQPAQDYGELAG